MNGLNIIPTQNKPYFSGMQWFVKSHNKNLEIPWMCISTAEKASFVRDQNDPQAWSQALQQVIS